jgi:hypothetical protein
MKTEKTKIKRETMLERLENETEEYLNDENVSEKRKKKFNSLGDSDTDLYKKYQMVSVWKSLLKSKEKNTEIENENKEEISNEIKELFKKLKLLVNPKEKKTFNLLSTLSKDFVEYIETSEERMIDEEIKKTEKEIAERQKKLEDLNKRKNTPV